ncbi:hypothetical protein LCGC14_1069940 [marine sediment metagenome]|uniref:Uncharacterized protein n=1 Tax=marine sediment metagenome TaxID=412755 RepID=A0A0F9MIM9_9ZZZZ
MKTWKCVCNQRHSGLPLKLYAPKHRPVSVWEARMAQS